MSPYYYMYPTCKISHTKKCMPAKLLLVDLFWKFPIYRNFIYSVMTLHYHRVYKISSLEANLSLEDLKQFCRQTHPKTNN